MDMRLGHGGRFASGVKKIEEKEGLSKDRASAIMAVAGRRKYGAQKMSAWAHRGMVKAQKRG